MTGSEDIVDTITNTADPTSRCARRRECDKMDRRGRAARPHRDHVRESLTGVLRALAISKGAGWGRVL